MQNLLELKGISRRVSDRFSLRDVTLAHMTQSAVKSHNGPADRLQSVGGACR